MNNNNLKSEDEMDKQHTTPDDNVTVTNLKAPGFELLA
jgi:hypothetical protein